MHPLCWFVVADGSTYGFLNSEVAWLKVCIYVQYDYCPEYWPAGKFGNSVCSMCTSIIDFSISHPNVFEQQVNEI